MNQNFLLPNSILGLLNFAKFSRPKNGIRKKEMLIHFLFLIRSFYRVAHRTSQSCAIADWHKAYS